jgi:hypothetical protein
VIILPAATSVTGQSLHIHDVRAMSACVPTAEVSARRGK